MRCKNCGWPNKANETVCVKCHTPLTGDEEEVTYSQSPSEQSSPKLNKTVLESEVFGGGSAYAEHQSTPAPTKAEQLSNCPKCGYPLRPGANKCPNCNFSIDDSAATNLSSEQRSRPQPSEDSNRRPTKMASANGQNGKFRGTVNPYMMNLEVEPSFVLKPLKRMDERHDFEEQEYEGKEVVLNRDNTEPNNSSITSRQQAVISYSDGHWYIEDKSDQKTTFVQAAEKLELQDGDIILLGNRLFEFHK
jgi:uncharacterized Zn finger protein (UPF0148 family)